MLFFKSEESACVCVIVSSHGMMSHEKAINTNAEVAPWLHKGGVRCKSADMIKVFVCLCETYRVRESNEQIQWRLHKLYSVSRSLNTHTQGSKMPHRQM